LTTGEGGGITARNPALIETAKKLRYCGIGKSGFDAAMQHANGRWWEHEITEPFIKMLPTNIAANIGLAQLEKIDMLQRRRKEIWYYYKETLNIPELVLPVNNKHDKHSYFTFCIRAQRRDELAKYLLDEGIYTTLRYHPLHLSPLYGQVDSFLPASEKLSREALNIPLHPRLTDDDVQYVIDSIRCFYGR
jgi:aminotransferase